MTPYPPIIYEGQVYQHPGNLAQLGGLNLNQYQFLRTSNGNSSDAASGAENAAADEAGPDPIDFEKIN